MRHVKFRSPTEQHISPESGKAKNSDIFSVQALSCHEVCSAHPSQSFSDIDMTASKLGVGLRKLSEGFPAHGDLQETPQGRCSNSCVLHNWGPWLG